MTDLGTLGGAISRAYAINDLGQVVGTSETASGDTHAFMWSASTGMTELATLPGTTQCEAADINDRGEAVGYCGQPFGIRRAVRWTNGQVNVVDPSATSSDEAYGINDLGEVLTLAHYQGSLYQYRVITGGNQILLRATLGHGVVPRWGEINDAGEAVMTLTDGVISTVEVSAPEGAPTTDIGNLGLRYKTAAWDLSERAEVVGETMLPSGATHAFLWAQGAMRDLGTLGGPDSTAHGINDRAEVVGKSITPAGESHAFRWSAGTMTDLGTLP